MVVVAQTMPAAAAEVFRVVSDPTTYPQWLAGAKRIRRVDREFPQPLSEFEHEVGAGPLVVRDTTVVEESEPNHKLEMMVRARPFLVAEVTFEIVAESDTSCCLRLSETPIGIYRFFSWAIDPLIRVRNTRSLEALAGYLGGSSVP